MSTSQHRKQVGARWVALQKGQIVPDQKKNWTIGEGVIVSRIQYSPGNARVEGIVNGKPFAIDL